MLRGRWNEVVERLIGEGYRFLMSAPTRSYGVVGQGRELAGY